jgi:hypothetical protein
MFITVTESGYYDTTGEQWNKPCTLNVQHIVSVHPLTINALHDSICIVLTNGESVNVHTDLATITSDLNRAAVTQIDGIVSTVGMLEDR